MAAVLCLAVVAFVVVLGYQSYQKSITRPTAVPAPPPPPPVHRSAPVPVPLSLHELAYHQVYQATGLTTPGAVRAALKPVPAWRIRGSLERTAVALTLARQSGAAAASVGAFAIDARRLDYRLEQSRLLLSELTRRLVVLMATYGKGWWKVPRDIRRYIDRDEKELKKMGKALKALHHSLMVAVAAGSDPNGEHSREVRQRIESMASAIERLAASDRHF